MTPREGPVTWNPHVRELLGDRFATKIEITESGCWEYMGCRDQCGYGRLSRSKNGKRTVYSAHRFAYMTLVGPIPKDKELDHLCRNPPCANPNHLEPVTHRENLHRGETVNARNAVKTVCYQGHSLADAYVDKRGQRDCNECRRLRGIRFRQNNPEKVKAWSKEYYERYGRERRRNRAKS